MYIYKYSIVDILTYKNSNVAVRLKDLTDLIKVIPIDNIWEYRHNIDNCIITKTGVIRAKHGSIKRRELTDNEYSSLKGIKPGKKVSNYTIMYANNEVIHYNRRNDTIKIINTKYLPYELRGLDSITEKDIYKWIKDRIDNINRTYMNVVYIARNVGRDSAKVIYDSAGISIIDNFWIKTSDSDLTWSKILALRDSNIALNNVALHGNLNVDGNLQDGKTSLFTLKGHFAKAILNGYMYKNISDSIYEYVAYLIGKQLGIDIQECSIDGEYVKIKLFTNNDVSLVHASQLNRYFGNDDLLYNNLTRTDRKDLVKQMQRLYIFNYIIGNPDLHEENYGLLYDANTFKIIKVAPCFDHNCAFQENFVGITNDVDLEDISMKFISGHKDIAESASKLDYSEISRYLRPLQINQIKQRIAKLLEVIK